MKKDVQESLVAWRKLIEWSRVDDHENKREEGSQRSHHKGPGR
jgi:hypothetical protein